MSGVALKEETCGWLPSGKLVAPKGDNIQFALGQREREVYLPAGNWRSLADGQLCEGGRTVLCAAPLDRIPVFERV